VALFGGNRSVAVNLSANVNDYVAKMRVAQKATTDFGRAAGQSATKNRADWDKLGKGMMVAGGAIGAGLALAVKSAADFDKQLSAVRSVSNASAADMDRLRTAALKAGADTSFSAKQAAEAETELAKVGISTADILGGALNGSLALAAAGQIDLGRAATISGQSMKIFGLQGKDVGHIADVLASGANKSAADVDQLSQAMSAGGLVAAQTGLSLEDTVGTLSAFADNALIGSDAGTSLKTMLQRLNPQSDEAAALMDELGLRAYDAQGNFVGLERYAGQLQRGLGGLSTEQRNAAMSTIFGSDAIRASNILVKLGSAGIHEYTSAVNDQGAAARTAAVQMDNLSGDFEQLRGSIETALIKTGSAGNGALRGLTQTATRAVNAFGSLPQGVQSAGFALGAVASSALLVGGAVVTLVPKIAATKASLDTLGISAARTSAAMRGLGAAAAVVAVGAVASELGSVVGQAQAANVATDDLTKSLTSLATNGQLSGAAFDVMSTRLGPFHDNVGTSAEALDRFGVSAYNALDQGWDARLGRFQSMGTTTARFKDQVGQLDTALASMVQAGNADQAKAAFDRLTAAAVKQGVPLASVQGQFTKYQQAVDTAKVSAASALAPTNDLAGAVDAAGAAAKKAAPETGTVADAMRLLGPGALSGSAAVKQLVKDLEAFQKEVGDAFGSATDVMTTFQVDSKKGAGSITSQLAGAFHDSLESARQFTHDITVVTRRGLDPGLIADLLKQGPKEAGPVLQAMVSDHSGRLIRMANRSQIALGKIESQVVEQARLTDLAMRAPTDRMPKDLAKAMRISAAEAKSGGKATAAALSHELGIAESDVKRIAGEFGISIATNVRTGTKKASTSVGDFYRVVRGGPVKHDVDFNTPGLKPSDTSTGAYFRRVQGGPTKHPITFTTPGLDAATSKVNTLRQAILDIPRSRSVSVSVATGIANKVSSQNAQLTKRAYGGYISGPGGPTEDAIPAYLSNGEYVVRAASVRKYGTEMLDMLNAGRFANGGQVGEGTKVVVQGRADLNNALSPVVQAIRSATDAVRASAAAVDAGGGGGGISGGGGAGMGWRKQWSIIHGAFPGAHLNSSFRPGAITATGNRSYHSLGRAIDVTPSMAIFNWIRSHYGRSTKELIYSPANGRQLWHGQPHMYTGITRAMHFNHVHWAMANGGPVGPAAVRRRPAPRRFAVGGPVTGGDYSSIASIVSSRQTVTPQDRADRAATLRKAQADLTAATKALTAGRRKDVKAEADARGSVRSARAGLADARRSHNHTRIVAATERLAAAERRLATARRDPNTDRAEANLTKRREALAKATTALHTTDRALQAQSRPLSVRYAEAAYTRNRVTGTFLHNLRTLADRGFGDLARQLTEMGGADAETLAAQAVRSTATARKLQTDFTVSARLQGQLAGAPAELAIRSALRTMKNPSLAGIAAATGLSTSDLQASLQAISGTLRGNGNAKTLLAGIRSQGFYSNGSFGSTTAAAGPTFHITVHNPTGDPYRAGEKAAQGVQRVLAVQGAW
jgi:TP901 family phage tail tape measure protein